MYLEKDIIFGVEWVDSIWRSCHPVLIRFWRPMLFLFLRWWAGLRWRSLPTGSRICEQGFFLFREMVYAREEDQMREIIWFSLSSKKVACRRPRIKWEKPTYIINSPFHLISQHVVHWWHHLDWHVDQSLTQHETDVCIWLRKQDFQSFVERGVVGGRNGKKVVGDGLYRGILLWYWRWYFLHRMEIVKN